MVTRPKDPKFPFPHKTRRDKSASNVFKKCCVSIQSILLHMFEFRLSKRSANNAGDHK